MIPNTSNHDLTIPPEATEALSTGTGYLVIWWSGWMDGDM
jgi:hypothetical protein